MMTHHCHRYCVLPATIALFHTPSIITIITMSTPRSSTSSSRFAQFKLVLLGESAVGKSSIVERFAKNVFDDYRESTIGAAFLTQTIQLDPNTTVKFEIWDTAGQERYKSLAPMYYRNANCAVVVYDITQSASLTRAKAWVKELQRQANENIVIALAGNKLDMAEGEPGVLTSPSNDPDSKGNSRQVSTEEAAAYAKEAGLLFFETSAKTGQNVTELFTAIAKKLPIESVLAQRGGAGAQGQKGGALGASRKGIDLKGPATGANSGCNC